MSDGFTAQDSTALEWSRREEYWWTMRTALGRWLYRSVGPAMEIASVEAQQALELARSPEPRLNAAEIEHLSAYLTEVFDRDIRRAFFDSRPLAQTFPGLLVPLIDAVIERDPRVASVMNIGAYYFFADHVLAMRHPTVRFQGVDLPDRLAEFNAEFLCDNLVAVSGYALDLIESGSLRADVVAFSATAAEIKNNELQRYFEVVKPFARWIVLSEPLYSLPGGAIVDPDDLPIDQSLAIYALPHYLPHRKGPLSRAHNYRAMLERAGYEVRHYHAFRPAFTDIRWVRVIAENVTVTAARGASPV